MLCGERDNGKFSGKKEAVCLCAMGNGERKSASVPRKKFVQGNAWATPLPSRSSSSKRGQSSSPSSSFAVSDAAHTPPSPGSCASHVPPGGLCGWAVRAVRA
eukprot:3525955-Prymnesium_polylepis.1